ncbi:MAG TPA: flagellar FliJ family protein [Candidatus Acidoferrales bacterium]|jgi:flagellar export protein FliJ|nr:flagellar FliJ family protein [Candidatus Acidoferrales bacterium]
MAFRFSLDAVLRMWKSRERFERLRLETLTAKIQRLRNEIQAVARASQQDRKNLANSLSEGMAASQLQFATLCTDGQRQFRALMEKQVAELMKQHESQRKIFERARRQRETLENLRTRKLEAYRAEEAREMQEQMDELFLVRRSATQSE